MNNVTPLYGSEDAPKAPVRNTLFVTEKTFLKNEAKRIRREIAKANKLLEARRKLDKLRQDLEAVRCDVRIGDRRPDWSRSPFLP